MPKPEPSSSAVDVEVRINLPPYLPFLTFQSAVASLEQGIPKKLDRTIWPSQSGLTQTQILMAFRFLGLVDDNDVPTEQLRHYVEAKDLRPQIMAALLNVAYADLLRHDLTKMTPKMVEDEIEGYRVTGETKRKAVTFFLRAAKFAEMPMHPLLSSMVRNTLPRGKRKKKGAVLEINGRSEIVPPPNPASQANTKVVRLSSGGTVSLSISADPFTLAADDRKFVFELIDKLQDYERNSEDNEITDEGEDQDS